MAHILKIQFTQSKDLQDVEITSSGDNGLINCQSYKCSMVINYKSRMVITRNF